MSSIKCLHVICIECDINSRMFKIIISLPFLFCIVVMFSFAMIIVIACSDSDSDSDNETKK